MPEATVRCAFITGGSSGIGLAVAKELVRRKADVLLIARDRNRLEQAVRVLTPERVNASGRIELQPRVRTLSLDVGNPEQVKEHLLRAVQEFGEPDFLLNCAGEAFPDYFDRIPDSLFEQTISVHLRGTWYVTKTLLPYLKKNQGIIVNVSSLAGLVGVFGYTAYSAAKAGVIGFSEALRSELVSEGVQIAVLCPPDTDTPGFEKENRRKPPETKAISANAGVLRPETVAEELFRGLSKGKFMIIPGFQARFTAWVARHMPIMVRWVMDRTVRNCRKQIQSK
ncbi:MAG: SDR family oxidoreductase [Spirochaetes bacterium]|nr:SDR family oxidoreductase [Spirochaetota bacterium]